MTAMKTKLPTTTKTAIKAAYDSLTSGVKPAAREHALELCARAVEHSNRGNRVMNADQTVAGGVTIRDVVKAAGFEITE